MHESKSAFYHSLIHSHSHTSMCWCFHPHSALKHSKRKKGFSSHIEELFSWGNFCEHIHVFFLSLSFSIFSLCSNLCEIIWNATIRSSYILLLLISIFFFLSFLLFFPPHQQQISPLQTSKRSSKILSSFTLCLSREEKRKKKLNNLVKFFYSTLSCFFIFYFAFHKCMYLESFIFFGKQHNVHDAREKRDENKWLLKLVRRERKQLLNINHEINSPSPSYRWTLLDRGKWVVSFSFFSFLKREK